MTEIPGWAIERVRELMRAEPEGVLWSVVCEHAFARYISEHEDPYEDPPVDPLLIEAREIVARYAETVKVWGAYSGAYRGGHRDSDSEIHVALAALERGIEIGKGEA